MLDCDISPVFQVGDIDQIKNGLGLTQRDTGRFFTDDIAIFIDLRPLRPGAAFFLAIMGFTFDGVGATSKYESFDTSPMTGIQGGSLQNSPIRIQPGIEAGTCP